MSAKTIRVAASAIRSAPTAPSISSALHRLAYRALEQRMVFDAALAETLAETTTPPDTPAATIADTADAAQFAALMEALPPATAPTASAAVDVQATFIAVPTGMDASVAAPSADLNIVRCSLPLPPLPASVIEAALASTPELQVTTATSVVFIDPRVESYETIAAHIAAGSELVVLDAEKDGLHQIANYLENRSNLESVHILSHGAAGEITLGSSVVTRVTLGDHSADLAIIGRALKADGDILIYGCDVASGDTGQQFVEAVSALTQHDVAASTDDTGSSALGGNWDLEVHTGAINAQSLANTDYAFLLALGAEDDVNAVAANATAPITGNVLTNDTGTGTKVVTEVHGSAARVGVAYAASYGTITLKADGSYSYAVDVNNTTVRGLIAGQSVTDIIAYAAKDGTTAGANYGYLTVTINGINDPPVAYDNFNSVTPTSAPSTQGNLITDTLPPPGTPADFIDRPQTQFQWGSLYGNANALNTSKTVGSGVNAVTVSVTGADPSNTGLGGVHNYVTTGQQGGKTGYLQLYIDPTGHTTGNATTGYSYVAPTTTLAFNKTVSNLEFTLLDVDTNNNPNGTWIDQVTISGTKTVNGITTVVTFSAQYSGWDTRNGNSFYGSNLNSAPTDAQGNIRVVFDGPVDNVKITFNDGPTATGYKTGTFGGHLVGVSDLSWQSAGGEKISQIVGASGVATAIPVAGVTVPATYGSITVQQNGTYVYNVDPNNAAVKALPAGATLIDNVPYTVLDSNGLTANAVLHVKINGINDAPIANADSAATLEDTAITLSAATLLANDTDVDTGDTRTLVSVQSAVNGSVSLDASGNPVFTPAANFVGTGSYTYTIRDAAGDTSNATVTVRIGSVNDAPSGADATRNVNEDTNYTFAAADFAVTDVNDTPANTLAAVVITTLPSSTDGILKLKGLAVTAGQIIVQADIGLLTFSPVADRNGTGLGSFTFQVRDNGGTTNGGVDTDTSPNTFKFNVASVKDTVADAISTLEDLPVSFNVLSGANGAANDNFEGAAQVTAVTQPANGSVVFANDGTLTFTPNANFNGSTSFTYTVTSGGVTEIETVTLTVAAVNDAPASTVPVSQSVNEDTNLVFAGATAISISDIDAGPNGIETVTLSVAHGTLTLGSTANISINAGSNGSGTITLTGKIGDINTALSGLTYKGDLNYNGPDQLAIRVLDDGLDKGATTSNGALASMIKVVPITVVPVNDPPAATADTATLNEDVATTFPKSVLLANDTDVDGDILTITSVQNPTHGTVTLDVNGNPVFTPEANYSGPASFTYTISDGNGGTSVATVNLTIAPVNDAPVANPDSYGTDENTVLTIAAGSGLTNNDTDIDGGALSVVQINGNVISPGAPIVLPSGAILTPNANGSFSYNPNHAYDRLATGDAAIDTFSYQVSDGKGGLATSAVTVNVVGVNTAPVAFADVNSTDPSRSIDIPKELGVLTNDIDRDTNQTALLVTAIDNGATSVGPNTAIAGTNGGIFKLQADGSYTFDPNGDFNALPIGSSATTSITYTISDGAGGFATATLTISVPFQNLPPYIATPPLAQASIDGNTVSIPLGSVFSDPNPVDQGRLTITASGLPPGLSIDAAGNITGTLTSAASQHAGPYVITLTATDTFGSQVSTTFNFSVGNAAPVAVNDSASVGEHATTAGNVVGNDRDGGGDNDPMQVTQINGVAFTPASVITLPSGAQLVMAANGSYSYDPHSAFNGLALGQSATDSFSYQVSDGQGGFATAIATITINGQNDAPVVIDPANPGVPPLDPNKVAPAQSGQDGTAITPLAVKGFFKDPDNGDTLTLSVTGALPAGVTFNATTGTFTGTPGTNASQGGPANNGVYTVLVNATDNNGAVVSTAVTFTIANPAPVAGDDTNTVLEHETATGNVVTNDRDGGGDRDVLSVNAVNGATLVPGSTISLPSGAQLVMQSNGAYTYNPNGAFASLATNATATDSFTYQVSDGQGGTSTATATIVIQGQNDGPVAVRDVNATNPSAVLAVGSASGVLSNDTDAEHDTLTVTSISNGSTTVAAGTQIAGTNGGLFTISANGAYTFNPNNAFDNLAPGTSASTSITYAISDGHGGTSQTTLIISVPFENLPPVVKQPIVTQTSADGAAISIPVGGVFGDPNSGDTLTISATGLPPGLVYNPATGAIEGTLTANASQNNGQPYTVTLTATDGIAGHVITSTFTFNVTNLVPIAVNDTNAVTEHGTTTGDVTSALAGNDRDGGGDNDVLTVSLINGLPYTPGGTVTLPSGALLVMNGDGTYSYDPNGAYNGLSVGQTDTDTFSYQISDGQGGVATATVTITINGQNEKPVIVDPASPGTPIDPNHVIPDQSGQDGTAITPLSVKAFFADADQADSLSLSVVDLPPGITFNAATGTFSGTPTAAASQGGNAGPGVYDVVVTANDGHGGTVSTTVRFTITNPAPVAAADNNSVNEHGTISGAASVIGNDNDPDSDALVVSHVNGSAAAIGTQIELPSGALLTMSANGTYDYNPNGAFAHLQDGDTITDSFVYQVSDGQGGFSTAKVTIIISGANDDPTANKDLNQVAAGGSLSVAAPLGVLSNDTDPERDPLVVTKVTVGGTTVSPGQTITGSQGGTFVINADGSYTFNTDSDFDNLDPGATAVTTVTYEISDGHGGTSTTTLTINVPFSNLPPILNRPVPAQASQDGATISIDVSNVFKDPNPSDASTLRATLTADPATLPPGLSFVDGRIVGTLSADASQHGPYVVVLTAEDAAGNAISSTFTFTVTNPPPVAIDDATSVFEHGTVGGDVTPVTAGNDSDGGNDSDPLTVTKVNGVDLPTSGSITLPSGAVLTMKPDGTYAYNPNGKFDGLAVNETGADSFTYQISDGQGGTSTATVAITINGENDQPVVVNPVNPGVVVPAGTQVVPTQTGFDGSPITPLAVANFFADPDGTDTLTLLPVDPYELPPGLSFNPATGTFSGTLGASASLGGPNNDGVYLIKVTASDGHGGTVSTTIKFDISNPAPVAIADTNAVDEHSVLTVISPAQGLLGNDRDGGADSDALKVTQINGMSLVPGATITLASGALLTVQADGTYSYDTNGKFNGLALGQTATESFTYQVSDEQGGFATSTATIVINGVNDAPALVNPATPLPPQSGQDGTPILPVSVAGYFTDPDRGDKLTLSVAPGSLPSGITLDPTTGTFSGTPSPDASSGGQLGNGVYVVKVTASDGKGGTVSTTITFTITNAPPIAVDDAERVDERGTVTSRVLGNDQDGGADNDRLTVTTVNGTTLAAGSNVITLPSGAILTIKPDGTYAYDPNGKFLKLAVGETATDQFTYKISDGQGGFATARVVITIVGENDVPVVVDPAHPGQPPADPNHVVATQVGQDGTAIKPLSVASVFADPDTTDKLTFSVPKGALPPGLSFDTATGVFTGVPGSNASQGGPNSDGVYPVVVTASDGHGGTVTTIVTFTFKNTPPVAADDRAHGQPGTTLVLSPLVNDRDGANDNDALTIVSAVPSNGTVVVNADGTISYTPSPDFVGLATIVYTISDGQGGTSTATVYVLITPKIHVTSPTPIIADQPGPALPLNTGIASDGAVVNAVQGVEPLNSISGGIAASGIVDRAANQFGNLGALGSGNSHVDPRITNPVWRLESMLTREFGRPLDTWAPEGLTGFSLRFTYASEIGEANKAELVLESLVRDRTLILNLSSTSIPSHAYVTEYRVMQSNGQPLPAWLDRVGPQVLMGERPVDVEMVKLRVIAILSDGTSIERDAVVQTNSGEIKPLGEKRAAIVPLFSDQLNRGTTTGSQDLDQILRSLER